MSSYRLDRTVFKVQTAESASQSDAAYYKTLTWQERLKIANYLNSIAYNYPENTPPKMDKTVFKIRSRD
jgi:outer membrane protease